MLKDMKIKCKCGVFNIIRITCILSSTAGSYILTYCKGIPQRNNIFLLFPIKNVYQCNKINLYEQGQQTYRVH